MSETNLLGEGWEVAVRGISEDAKLGTTTEGVVPHFDFKHAFIAFIGLHGSELGLLRQICPQKPLSLNLHRKLVQKRKREPA